MSKFGLYVVAGVAVFTMLLLVYFAATFEAPTGTTTVVIAPPVQEQVAEPEPAAPATSVLPQIRLEPQAPPPAVAASEPVIEAPAVEVEVPEPEPVAEEPADPALQLPSLNDSDGFVFENLQALQNGAALVELLARDQIVRKFVVFVENISRGEFPQTSLPYRPIGVEMPASNIDDNLFVMDDSAHDRFDNVVDTFVSIDTGAAMAFYRILAPLFQQAYAEIGFRDVSFDDTLRRAINTVLQTNEVEGPYQLVKPSVMFLYADASIENLQEVHKQLIRIGPENTAKLKDKLRQFMIQL